MYHLAILDDNETWCYVLALRLHQQGYKVSTFASAQALLQEIEQFDLVLVDFSLPTPRHQRSMDGTEVICWVKQQLEHPPLLVLISSFFTDDVLAQADELCPEADALWSKQSETDELLTQIQQLIVCERYSEQKLNQPFQSSLRQG